MVFGSSEEMVFFHLADQDLCLSGEAQALVRVSGVMESMKSQGLVDAWRADVSGGLVSVSWSERFPLRESRVERPLSDFSRAEASVIRVMRS